MITEKELQEKRRKKTNRLVLVLFLVLILIPVFLYLLAPESPERVNRLYFAGYVLMAATIYYSVQTISRALAEQKIPVLEAMLTKSETSAIFPQEYLDLTEQIKRSIQSRRYFKRSLARRLIPLLKGKELAESKDLLHAENLLESREAISEEPRLTYVLASLYEPKEEAPPPSADHRLRDSLSAIIARIADFWDSITGQGMSAKELEKIITSIKEL